MCKLGDGLALVVVMIIPATIFVIPFLWLVDHLQKWAGVSDITVIMSCLGLTLIIPVVFGVVGGMYDRRHSRS